MKKKENCKNYCPKEKNLFIGSIEKVSDYVKENQFILKGYRINMNSFKHVVKSLFMIHNETINIWTHYLGAIILLLVTINFAIYYGKLKDHHFI